MWLLLRDNLKVAGSSPAFGSSYWDLKSQSKAELGSSSTFFFRLSSNHCAFYLSLLVLFHYTHVKLCQTFFTLVRLRFESNKMQSSGKTFGRNKCETVLPLLSITSTYTYGQTLPYHIISFIIYLCCTSYLIRLRYAPLTRSGLLFGICFHPLAQINHNVVVT